MEGVERWGRGWRGGGKRVEREGRAGVKRVWRGEKGGEQVRRRESGCGGRRAGFAEGEGVCLGG